MTVDEQLDESYRSLLEDLVAKDVARRDKQLRSQFTTAFKQVFGVEPHITEAYPFNDPLFLVAGVHWRIRYENGRYYLLVQAKDGPSISVHRPADLEGVDFESLA